MLTRREHVIALEPKGRGLLGLTLRFPYEVRDALHHSLELGTASLAEMKTRFQSSEG